ncbi:MAG: Lrp/AsnC family transcriptional regulator [Candidatus Methanodesulfokora sp.]
MQEKLSDAERKILKILQEDGRASYSKMGKMLGMTHVGARKHTLNLMSRGIMRVSACLNPRALGLRHALILIETLDDRSANRIVERFRNCPRLVFLSRLIGGNNIVAIVIAENMDVLESITSVCALRTAEGIRRSEVIVGSNIIYPEHLPIRIVAEKSQAPCGLDCCSCNRFRDNHCLGCPASSCYRGPL